MEIIEKEISRALLKLKKRLLREMAVKMLQEGVPPRAVVRITGLTQSWIYVQWRKILRATDGQEKN